MSGRAVIPPRGTVQGGGRQLSRNEVPRRLTRWTTKWGLTMHRRSALFLGLALVATSCEPITDTHSAPPISASRSEADATNASTYEFTPLAFLGDPAPGGGTFTFDFEPGSLNNRGEATFAADVTTGGEGIFLASGGQILQIARAGGPAPGGGTFSPDFGLVLAGATPINDRGDVAFAFTLNPFTRPLGVNTGLYRFSRTLGTLEAVVVPEVTPAPAGGVFAGAALAHQMNNRGDIVFQGVLHDADIALGPPGADGLGLGIGGFVADKHGSISSVVSPGDAAPGGGIFDYGTVSSINDRGDVIFLAHVDGDECVGSSAQEQDIGCLGSAFLKAAPTGEIRLIVRQGGPAPGGGTCRGAARSLVNNRRQVAFGCDMAAPGERLFNVLGLFFQSEGQTVPIARPGDPMPGGGNSLRPGAGDLVHLNNAGDVTFANRLDTGEDAVYVWSRGSLRLVARTGTVIRGVGTIVALLPPDLVGGRRRFVWEGISANDRGQVLFTAAVDDGSGSLRGVLLLATPRHAA